MENTQRIIFICVFIVPIVYASDAVTLETLVERIVRLEERDRVQQNEINRLEERDQLQLKRITHLEESNRLQSDEIDKHTERVQTQEDEIKEIRHPLLTQKKNTQNPRMRTGYVKADKSKRRVLIVDKLVSEANDISYRRSQRKLVK